MSSSSENAVRNLNTAKASLLPPNQVGDAPAKVLNATALQQQFAASVANSSSYPVLQARLTDTYQRIRSPLAATWCVQANGTVVPRSDRLTGPVLGREDVQRELAQSAAICIHEQRDVIQASELVRNLTAIHVPCLRTDSVVDSFVVLVVNADEQQVNNELMSAHHLVRSVEDWWKDRASEQLESQLHGTAAILDLVERITHGTNLNDSCSILCNTLRQHFSGKLVAVGLRGNSGLTCRVEAISGMGEFDRSSHKVRSIQAALDECAVRGDVCVWPVRTESQMYQLLATKQAVEELSLPFMISVPLRKAGEEICGALLVASDDSTLVGDNAVNFLAASGGPVGAELSTVRRADGGRFRQLGQKLFAKKQLSRWRIAGLAAGVLTLMMLIPVPYRIPCRCTIEPVEKRFGVAPYDGLIENTFAQPGDTVKAGQLLARMDGREVQWELASVTAEASRAMKERDTHMARLEVPKSIMASLDVDRLSNRSQLLKYRADNMDICSPIDGVILTGTVDRRENFPVKVGQTLYEIAPLKKVRIEIAVPDDEAVHVQAGMPVEVRIDAFAGTVLAGEILRIRPRSETRHEDNVFIAEVEIDNPDSRLRPGAEGNARIIGDRRSMGWILFHRAWEKTMTAFFW